MLGLPVFVGFKSLLKVVKFASILRLSSLLVYFGIFLNSDRFWKVLTVIVIQGQVGSVTDNIWESLSLLSRFKPDMGLFETFGVDLSTTPGCGRVDAPRREWDLWESNAR